MLQQQIAEWERRGWGGERLERAKKLLAEAPVRVLTAPGANGLRWAEEKDRSLADQVRVEILEALRALTAQEMDE